MNFTLCVLVYNYNGSVQALWLAHYAKCLHRPIVIINQQYTKGEIHFINKIRSILVGCSNCIGDNGRMKY